MAGFDPNEPRNRKGRWTGTWPERTEPPANYRDTYTGKPKPNYSQPRGQRTLFQKETVKSQRTKSQYLKEHRKIEGVAPSDLTKSLKKTQYTRLNRKMPPAPKGLAETSPKGAPYTIPVQGVPGWKDVLAQQEAQRKAAQQAQQAARVKREGIIGTREQWKKSPSASREYMYYGFGHSDRVLSTTDKVGQRVLKGLNALEYGIHKVDKLLQKFIK